MNLKVKLFTKNDVLKDGKIIKPAGIMIHSTGANNPKLSRYVDLGQNAMNWNRPGLDKAVHAFIGKDLDGSIATYQTLNWTKRGWHCGKGTKGSCNNTHIGFEVCEDDLSSLEYFNGIYKEAVEFCAYLCKMFYLDPMKDGVIISHHEGYTRGLASNHADIDHWFKKFNKTMEQFRNDVKMEMQGETKTIETMISELSKNPNSYVTKQEMIEIIKLLEV